MGKRNYTVIDTDIHPVISSKRVLDFLPEPWRGRYASGVELELLTKVRVVVALGKIAFDSLVNALKTSSVISSMPVSRLKFAHGAEWQINEKLWLITSFHPSQQNTFTQRLTEPMFDDIFRRARELSRPLHARSRCSGD